MRVMRSPPQSGQDRPWPNDGSSPRCLPRRFAASQVSYWDRQHPVGVVRPMEITALPLPTTPQLQGVWQPHRPFAGQGAATNG